MHISFLPFSEFGNVGQKAICLVRKVRDISSTQILLRTTRFNVEEQRAIFSIYLISIYLYTYVSIISIPIHLLYGCISARVLITCWQLYKMADVMQQTGSTCTCSAGISQQLSCVALIYTDVLIEVLSVEISGRNAADYQVNIVLICP